MSTPKTYTLAIQFGHLVKLNELAVNLKLVFEGAARSATLLQHSPDMRPALLAASEAISVPMVALLLELIRQGVPSPLSTPKPPDYLVLHLVLSEPVLQGMGQIATSLVCAWDDFQKIIKQPQPAPVWNLLQQYRKDSAEVAGYLLAALADAGVPNVPTR